MLRRSLVDGGGRPAAGLILAAAVCLLAAWSVWPKSGVTAVSAASAPRAARHEVKRGDTLYDLALAYRTDVNAIKKANGLTGDTIYPGQSLVIPPGGSQLYRVKPGDCLWNIAVRFGTTVDALVKANNLNNPNRLAVGTVLTVPAGFPAGSEAKAASTGVLGGLRFRWPLRGLITSNYGLREGRMHQGIDIAASYGDNIRAAADGVVQSVGWISGYGQAVIVRHVNGYRTLYAHVQKALVKSGAPVKQGQVIATVGSTGRSTGPHLHFEISKNSRTMDPLATLAP